MLVQIENPDPAVTSVVRNLPKDFHVFETPVGPHLLLVNGSRVYTIPTELANKLRGNPSNAEKTLDRLGLKAAPYINVDPVQDPPLRAISRARAALAASRR